MRIKAVALSCLVSCLFAAEPVFAVRVPQTAPKALKETQDPQTVKAHEETLKSTDLKPTNAPLISAEQVQRIVELVQKNSQREDQPLESLEVIFKKDGTLAHLQVLAPHDAKRTPNDSQQNHTVCRALIDGKSGSLKLTEKETVEGPDLYEILAIAQLPTACQELAAIQILQQTFTRNGLNYALQANAIVAPDGKSWAWEIAPSEEQMPNVIYGFYYYPITREVHSIRLDNKKAAAKLEKAVKDAGLKLKWVKDMNER